jgi:hypothetical protein
MTELLGLSARKPALQPPPTQKRPLEALDLPSKAAQFCCGAARLTAVQKPQKGSHACFT